MGRNDLYSEFKALAKKLSSETSTSVVRNVNQESPVSMLVFPGGD